MLSNNRKGCHDLKIANGMKLPVSSALSSSFNFSRSTSGCSDTGIGINISSAEHCPVIIHRGYSNFWNEYAIYFIE